jgi:CubicO group peptidase (beta-lactamase class C family)
VNGTLELGNERREPSVNFAADGGAGVALSRTGLDRLGTVLAAAIERGDTPGLVALVHRRGETHVIALGAMEADGGAPMRRDAIFRIASMTKPISAAAAMILVEEGRLRLDEPVDGLLPELANRRVLRRIDAELDDTVPAERPITLRDLLTFTAGFGMVLLPAGSTPIQRAIDEAKVGPGPDTPEADEDVWMKRLGALPLVHQPGAAFMYHTAAEVLGVLIGRAAGQHFDDFARERLFEPLGMADTGFVVPPEKAGRVPGRYETDWGSGATVRRDDPRPWDRPPAFPSGGTGLWSTADDYLAFCRMLLDKGRHPGGRILSRPAVELMTTDQLTPQQKAGGEILLGSGGWGFGMAVDTRRDQLYSSPGRFGWNGGLGTTAYSDPAEDLVGILLTNRAATSPRPPRVVVDFWTAAYAAIND